MASLASCGKDYIKFIIIHILYQKCVVKGFVYFNISSTLTSVGHIETRSLTETGSLGMN